MTLKQPWWDGCRWLRLLLCVATLLNYYPHTPLQMETYNLCYIWRCFARHYYTKVTLLDIYSQVVVFSFMLQTNLDNGYCSLPHRTRVKFVFLWKSILVKGYQLFISGIWSILWDDLSWIYKNSGWLQSICWISLYCLVERLSSVLEYD